jgi:hypothetical protein
MRCSRWFTTELPKDKRRWISCPRDAESGFLLKRTAQDNPSDAKAGTISPVENATKRRPHPIVEARLVIRIVIEICSLR